MPIAGTAGLTFGITSDAVALWQSASVTSKAEKVTAKNGSGTTVGVCVYDPTKEAKVEGLLLSDTVTAKVGTVTAQTFGESLLTGNWLVDSTETSKGNTEFTKISVSCTQYPGTTGIGG